MLLNSGFIYFVSGDDLFRIDAAKNVSNLGSVFGSGRARLRNLGQPADNEIIILNGTGTGYTYSDGAGLAIISDGDWDGSVHGDTLNERFFAAISGKNEVQFSAISDATSYGANDFFSAEEDADNVVGCVTKKSVLWVFGERSVEAWQTSTDSSLPVRKIQGATLERGCSSVNSISTVDEYTAWLADDGTVRMLVGSQMTKISDLELERKIRGSAKTAGFTKSDDAIGFWIDGPVHKRYVLTFPTADFTWVYDLGTGLSHELTSEGIGRWRGNAAVSAFDTILIGSYDTNEIWEYDPQTFDESGDDLAAELVSDSISFPMNVTIPLIEVEMETGVGILSGQGSDPEMLVYYSKDGGETFTQASSVKLGEIGQYTKRVPLRQFGRLVRHNDFVLKLRVTDPVEVTFYGAVIYYE
jgi:hypothetical protein